VSLLLTDALQALTKEIEFKRHWTENAAWQQVIQSIYRMFGAKPIKATKNRLHSP